MKYKITRFYFEPNIKAKTIKRGLTLKEAQKHCRDPETSSKTCKKPTNKRRTALYGDWFDGYTAQM